MDSNTNTKLPDWLDEKAIAMLRQDLADCDNPYTDEEALNIPYDGTYDVKRDRAHTAKEILSTYGLL